MHVMGFRNRLAGTGRHRQTRCMEAVAAPAQVTSSVIATESVSVVIDGLTILDDVSVQASPGRITGLIGPNGAGKTTVFNVISGFVKPTRGYVKVDDQRVSRMRPYDLTRLGIARTLQGVGLFASLTNAQNVALAHPAKRGFLSDALAIPWSDTEQRDALERARHVLADLGVEAVADLFPAEIPYPLQKRVALARALFSDPRVLLLDEPAGGISAEDISDLARLMRTWTPQRSVVLVEHHMELVMEVCDDIWVLDAGRVIAHGTPDEIKRDPAVIAAYLGDDSGEAIA